MLQQNEATPQSSSIPSTFTNEDSKYAVADILTSFASGEPATPTSLFSTVTSTADLLTPTTLVNLEQSLIDLQVGVAASPLNLTRESGFVPPVINPSTTAAMVKQEYSDYVFQDESSQDDAEWLPPGAKQPRYNTNALVIQPYSLTQSPATSGRRRKRADENLSAEEQERRNIRRERNKVAAAKCRQRRVDLTNKLLVESEGLEEEQSKLENEIQMLQQQKEQLAFLLEAHKPNCAATVTHTMVKSETVDSHHYSVQPSVQSTIVSLCSSTYQTPAKTSAVAASNILTGSRPNTLPIPASQVSTVTEVTGVPITTPSGVFSFGLDSMLDGHTGLTPITGTPSCASQLQRNSTDGNSSPDNLASPTTLMAL